MTVGLAIWQHLEEMVYMLFSFSFLAVPTALAPNLKSILYSAFV
jgi:hypothetical protein